MGNLSDIIATVDQILGKISQNKWKVRTGVTPTFVYTAPQSVKSLESYLINVKNNINTNSTQFTGYLNTSDKNGYMDQPEVRQVVRQASSEFVPVSRMISYTAKVQSMQIIMGKRQSEECFTPAKNLSSILSTSINTKDTSLPAFSTTSTAIDAAITQIQNDLNNFKIALETQLILSQNVSRIEREIYFKEEKLGGFFGSVISFVTSSPENYNVVKDSLTYMPYSGIRANVDAWRLRISQATPDTINQVMDAIMVEVKNYTDSTFNYSAYVITELDKVGA